MKTEYLLSDGTKISNPVIDATLEAIQTQLSKYPKGANGLTPDSAKDAEWKQAKAAHAYWFKRLQEYNKAFLKAHKHKGFILKDGKRVSIYEPKKVKP